MVVATDWSALQHLWEKTVSGKHCATCCIASSNFIWLGTNRATCVGEMQEEQGCCRWENAKQKKYREVTCRSLKKTHNMIQVWSLESLMNYSIYPYCIILSYTHLISILALYHDAGAPSATSLDTKCILSYSTDSTALPAMKESQHRYVGRSMEKAGLGHGLLLLGTCSLDQTCQDEREKWNEVKHVKHVKQR